MQPAYSQSEVSRLNESFEQCATISSDETPANFIPRPPSREHNRLLRRTHSNPENADETKRLPALLKVGKPSKGTGHNSRALEPIPRANDILKLTRMPKTQSVEDFPNSARHKKLERSQTAPVALLKPLKFMKTSSEDLRKNMCKLTTEQRCRQAMYSSRKEQTNYESGNLSSKSKDDLRKNICTLHAERFRQNSYSSRKGQSNYDSMLLSGESTESRTISPVMRVLPNGRRIVTRTPLQSTNPPTTTDVHSASSRKETTKDDYETSELDSKSDEQIEDFFEVKQNDKIERKEKSSELTYLTFARDRQEDNNRI